MTESLSQSYSKRRGGGAAPPAPPLVVSWPVTVPLLGEPVNPYHESFSQSTPSTQETQGGAPPPHPL